MINRLKVINIMNMEQSSFQCDESPKNGANQVKEGSTLLKSRHRGLKPLQYSRQAK